MASGTGERTRGRGIQPGATVAARELEAVTGDKVRVPDPVRLTHLQFRRFAGCPICHVHVQAIRARHQELDAAGIREVVLFHSTTAALREHLELEMPFAIVGDPHKRLYREFGVESSLLSVLKPKVLAVELRGLRTKRRALGFDLHGGPLGLPADFLIAPSGEVLASKYGTDAYDQWSVDEILALAVRFSDPQACTFDVRTIPIEETRPLRHAVLRPHQDVEELISHETEGALAVGAFDDGDLVAVGFVAPTDDGWRVRGMATAPRARGRGAGAAVLDGLVNHAREQGADRVWATVRIPARTLYERAGFTAASDEYEIPDIGPHVVMELR